MGKFLLVAVIAFVSFNSFCSEKKRAALECSEHKSFEVCDIKIPSVHLKKDIRNLVYGPSDIEWEGLPLLIFLHGRGGNSLNALKSQIMGLGLEEYFKSEDFIESPFVLVAPQDEFLHGGSTGQDYWLGEIDSKRSWPRFLSMELVSYFKRRGIGKTSCDRIVSGISMGAHGALLMGMNYPESFAAVAGHSPIFRSEIEDVMSYDEDVFGSETAIEIFKRRSVGSRIVYSNESFDIPVFIDIGEEDSLLIHKYKSGIKVWEVLEESDSLVMGSVIKRGRALNGSAGHGGGYWKSMFFSDYFPWYQSIFKNSEICQKR